MSDFAIGRSTSWSEEDAARVAELAFEGRGEWEYLPPLPTDPLGDASQDPSTLWLGPCIARMRPDGQAQLIELRGTPTQNAEILERAGLFDREKNS